MASALKVKPGPSAEMKRRPDFSITPSRSTKIWSLLTTMIFNHSFAQLPGCCIGSTKDPLGFLIHEGGASSMTEAAYRYARHEPGVDIVLFGTGDSGHLRANVESILKPPLPESDRQKLATLFGQLTAGVGLDSHQHSAPGR